MNKVITRFAPSPTGFMHIGGIRTALFSYLFARKNNGTFILRIEDTDKVREVEGSITHIESSLAWLGIEYDSGPATSGPWGSNIQSQRLDKYKKYAEQLIADGKAYADPYTAAEIAEFRRQATEKKEPFLFRNVRPTNTPVWDGTQPLRLKSEAKRYKWHDAVRGDLEAGPEAVDDIVLIKSDGYPTYNFAHIIDDFEMGVTHIMRGDEFISSMPKFLSIYEALKITPPVFVTLPPILRDDRTKKLGKRDGAKDILEYKKEGFLPETMVNFLALIGWNPGTEQELFSMNELIQQFSIERIQSAGGAFNEEKLLWMNKQHLGKLNDEAFTAYVMNFGGDSLRKLPYFTEERFTRLIPTLRERVELGRLLADAIAAGEYDFAFTDVTPPSALLRWKNDDSAVAALPRLQNAKEILSTADFTSPDTIKTSVWAYAEEVGKGELLWPLRVALTGLERSVDPFTAAYILGKDHTIDRIQNAINSLENAA